MTSARRLSTLAAVGVAVAGGTTLMMGGTAQAATPSAPCSAVARACVDLSTQQAWLMHNGVVTYGPVSVRTGKASAPTDPGTFRVTFKDRNHHSREFNNAPMPYSVFFHGGDAFHEGSLHTASNGCVHLSYSAARTFYATLQPGDVVQVVR